MKRNANSQTISDVFPEAEMLGDFGAHAAVETIAAPQDFEWVCDLDASLAVVVVSESGGWFIGASDSFLDALCLSRAAAIGRRVEDTLMVETALPLSQLITQVAATGEAGEIVLSVRTDNRQMNRLLVTAKPARGRLRAVTLETRIQAERHTPIARHRSFLFEQLHLINHGVTYVYDPANGEQGDLAELLGFPPSLVARAHGTERVIQVHPRDKPLARAHREKIAGLADGDFATVQCRMRRIDGEWRWIEMRERVFSRHNGVVQRVLGFAVDVTEQRRLIESLAAVSKALLTAEEQERRRIARELHDSVAQHLVAIDLTVSRFERQVGATEHREILHDIREALSTAHREVRTFSYLLHPPNLERLGLKTTLERFLSGFALRTGLVIDLDFDPAMPPLGAVADLAMFRVAQEALMNVHKHAQAHRVEVRLRLVKGRAVLTIRDDGVGLSSAQIEVLLADDVGGVGVAGMRARVEQIGGRFDMRPGPAGLIVQASTPVPASLA